MPIRLSNAWPLLLVCAVIFVGCDDGGGGESINAVPSAQISIRAQDSLGVTLSAASSSDPDGSIASYDWEFGDGASESGEEVSHVYGDPGSYTATLTVTINGVDDTPIATDNTADVTENTSPSDSGNLITDDDGNGVDNDPEGAPIQVGMIDGVTDPSSNVTGTYGTLDWETDGSYTYTLGPAAEALSAGQMASDSFTYTLESLGPGPAQTVVDYTFGNADPSNEGLGITASPLTESGTLTTFDTGFDGSYATQPVLRIGVTDNDTNTEAEAVTKDSYFEFTLTPSTVVFLQELSFDVGRGGGSTARGFAVRSSVDGFSTTLLTDPTVDSQRPNFTNYAADLTAFSPAFDNLTTPVTFRVYAFTPSTGNTLEFDNFNVTGATLAPTASDTATLTVNITGTNDAPVADDADAEAGDEIAELVITRTGLPEARLPLVADRDVTYGGFLPRVRSAGLTLCRARSPSRITVASQRAASPTTGPRVTK